MKPIEKYNPSENPRWDPDALVEVTFTGVNFTIKNGFCQLYKVKSDYLTTTTHWFIDNGVAEPNEPTLAFIKFISPEAYPHCLMKGETIEVTNSIDLLGKAKLIEIYNELLIKSS